MAEEKQEDLSNNLSVSLPDMVLASSLTSLPRVNQADDGSAHVTRVSHGLHPCEDVDKGWAWVVMAACALVVLLTNGISYSVGVLYLPMLDAFGESEAITSMVGSIFMGLSMLTGILASILCQRFDCRRTCMLAGCLFTIGLGTSSLGTSCTFLIITLGVIGGTGMTFAYTSVHISVSHYFHKRRPFAISVLHTGGSLGQVIFGPLTHFFVDLYTWRGACLLLGGLGLHLVVAGALLRPHKNEVLHKAYSNEKRAPLLDLTLLKNLSFDCFIITVLFMCVALGMVYIHFPAYTVYNGTSEHAAAMLLSVIGITSMSLKLLVGGAMSHESVDIWTVYTMSHSIVGILTVLAPYYMGNFSGQLSYAILFGTYSAPFVICTTSLAATYAKTSQLGFAMGMLSFASGIGLFAGPVIAGLVYSGTGSYASAVQLAGGCLLASTGLMFMAAIFAKTTKPKDDQSASVEPKGAQEKPEP